jgi:peroxiredoxin
LRRFEAMKEELGQHEVKVVALSKDSIKDAAHHKRRDKLSFTVLSDPKLEVLQQYGVEHHKAIEFSSISFSIFGVPLALVPSIKKMAIPTSLLIDEEGVIRWVDQTDDYRLRSNEERIMTAVKEAFGS